MPFVTASDGAELHYEVEGEGFPLVFTHGNMGFGQQSFLQTRIFRKRYRCILHDLRGCGLSDKPRSEVYDTTIHSSDLQTILQALGIKKAVHLGHSFGGAAIVRGLDGNYRSRHGLRMPDRVNLFYTHTPFAFENNLEWISGYTDELQDAAFEALEKRRV